MKLMKEHLKPSGYFYGEIVENNALTLDIIKKYYSNNNIRPFKKVSFFLLDKKFPNCKQKLEIRK